MNKLDNTIINNNLLCKLKYLQCNTQLDTLDKWIKQTNIYFCGRFSFLYNYLIDSLYS